MIKSNKTSQNRGVSTRYSTIGCDAEASNYYYYKTWNYFDIHKILWHHEEQDVMSDDGLFQIYVIVSL